MKYVSPLKQARLRAGFSLSDAASFLSVHPTTLLRYERGEVPLPSRLLSPLSELYRTSPAALCQASETEFLLKKDFCCFYWQPSRASPSNRLASYLEAFSSPKEETLLYYFRLLDKRAKHQLLGLAILLAGTKRKAPSKKLDAGSSVFKKQG